MGPLRGHIGLYKNNFFQNVVIIAYQVKGNESYNNMLANVLPLHQMVSKGQTIFFLKIVMLHIKLKGKTCRTLCKFDLMHTPDLLG